EGRCERLDERLQRKYHGPHGGTSILCGRYHPQRYEEPPPPSPLTSQEIPVRLFMKTCESSGVESPRKDSHPTISSGTRCEIWPTVCGQKRTDPQEGPWLLLQRIHRPWTTGECKSTGASGELLSARLGGWGSKVSNCCR